MVSLRSASWRIFALILSSSLVTCHFDRIKCLLYAALSLGDY